MQRRLPDFPDLCRSKTHDVADGITNECVPIEFWGAFLTGVHETCEELDFRACWVVQRRDHWLGDGHCAIDCLGGVPAFEVVCAVE